MAVEDAVLDFHVTEELNGPDGRQLRGLLVAAARETVMSNVAAVQDADLRVASVDLTSFAVLRSAGRQHSEVGTEALLDIGSRVSNLVIHSGGTPRFVRILLSGGQDVTDAVAERLGVPAALAEGVKRGTVEDLSPSERQLAESAVQLMTEVFVDEIRSSLDYYGASNAQFPVERILLSGGGSLLHGLAGHLEQVTRRPVHVADVLGGVRVGRTGLDDDQLAAIHPLAAVPVGLALGVIS
jgi:type IV pilus assembly protein PilM